MKEVVQKASSFIFDYALFILVISEGRSDLNNTTFLKAVEQVEPHLINNQDKSIKLFPGYHCQQLGVVNRSGALQVND
jgi:hypothetical protein